MRRAQKELAQYIISSLGQAHDQIKSGMERQEFKSVLNMLVECQDKAIRLGNIIEKSEGDGTRAVSMLEEYCEMAYRLYVRLEAGEEVDSGNAYGSLKLQIDGVQKSISDDIPIRKEVVFFPYKASMWDSLESVWRAADADPEYDVYVVPIPYYDKNADGSFNEKHYEIGEYPDDVPVMDYRDYELEERHPDIVFIHNPYDQYNRVTSIEPRFYTRNLKNHADKLVYIPYFAVGENMFEGMCVTHGALFADVVIAHSKAAKEDYVRYLKKLLVGSLDIAEEKIENAIRGKIYPLGSPKIDKVVNGDRERCLLPEEWKSKLDGKKAVLYNTGVSGILGGNELELKKICDTMRFFANREDVVLWWRPHPLAEGTMQSMRGGLLQKYLSIVDEYKNSSIGIYDDTADLQRALLWTDMYYGDDSSLVYLYGVQGKPIVMQNIYCLADGGKEGNAAGVSYKVSCQVLEDVYFFAFGYNRLYRMDSKGKIEAVAKAPGEWEFENSLYSGMIYHGQTIWLIPSRAHKLGAYSVITGQWEQYDLPDRIKSYGRMGDKIYMLSSNYGSMWVLDLPTKSLTKKDILYRGHKKFYISDEYYNDDLYLVGGKLYFLVTHSATIGKYDIVSGEAELLQIAPDDCQYQRLIYDGDRFWLLPSSDKIGVACWDGNQTREGDAGGYPEGFSSPNGFSHAISAEGRLWLFPYRGNKVLCMDKETMGIVCDFPMERVMGSETAAIRNVLCLKDGRALISASTLGGGNRVVIWNFAEEAIALRDFADRDCDSARYDRMLERLEHEGYASSYAYVVSEDETYRLDRICDALAGSDCRYAGMEGYYKSLYANSDGSAGARIWREVRM